MVLDKAADFCHIIDVAVPGDTRFACKEKEKVQKYQDLAREMRKLWKVRVEVIPIVVGHWVLSQVPREPSRRNWL